MEHFWAIGGEKGQLYQIVVIEVILFMPDWASYWYVSWLDQYKRNFRAQLPAWFPLNCSWFRILLNLKTLMAENSSLNGTLLVFKRSNHFPGVCVVSSIASSQMSRKGISHYGDVWEQI